MSERRTHKIQVQLEIHDDEKLGKLEELADVDNEIDAVMGKKAAAAADFNAELKGLRANRTEILKSLHDGVHTVSLDVYTVVDEQLGQVMTYRCDNDELLPELTRALTPAERQMSFEDIAPEPAGDESEVGEPGSDEDEPQSEDEDEDEEIEREDPEEMAE